MSNICVCLEIYINRLSYEANTMFVPQIPLEKPYVSVEIFWLLSYVWREMGPRNIYVWREN